MQNVYDKRENISACAAGKNSAEIRLQTKTRPPSSPVTKNCSHRSFHKTRGGIRKTTYRQTETIIILSYIPRRDNILISSGTRREKLPRINRAALKLHRGPLPYTEFFSGKIIGEWLIIISSGGRVLVSFRQKKMINNSFFFCPN